jgi:hypothetical protein
VIIHFGVDGTGDTDQDTDGKDPRSSYVHRLACLFKAAGPSDYVPGPELWGSQVPQESQQAVEYVMAHRPADGCCGIFLSGHGRGGVALIDAARQLGQKGVTVDCLILFDAVSRTGKVWLPHIPSNVKRVVYPRRDPRGLSRPEFSHCGILWKPPTSSYETNVFFTTHGGVGGKPWQVPSDKSDTDLVCELVGPVEKPTNVTFAQDHAGAELVWSWTWPRVLRAYHEVAGNRFPEPTLPYLTADQLNAIGTGNTLLCRPSGAGSS